MLHRVRSLVRVFSRPTRVRLLMASAFSVGLAVGEIVGLLSVVPLMQLLAGFTTEDSPVLELLANIIGTDDPDSLLLFTALAMMVAFTAKGLAAIATRWWVLGVIYNEESALSRRLMRYYVKAPYNLHLERNSAELTRTMIESVSHVFMYVVIGLVGGLTESIFRLMLMCTLVIVLPLPTLGFVIYFGLAGAIFLRVLHAKSHVYGQALSDGSLAMYRAASQTLGGIKEIQIRHTSAYFWSALETRAEFAWARRRSAFVTELPKYFLEILFMTGFALLAVVLILQKSGREALPFLGFVVATGFRILPSVARLLGALSSMKLGYSALDIVLADLRAESEVKADEPVPAGVRVGVKQEVELRNVSFAYSASKAQVLRDVNLTLRVGTSIALVGASGAGKTTLVDILMGLHAPSMGSVLVDGVDIQTNIRGWQESIGMVSQDVYLIDDTFRANIAFGQRPEEIDELRLASAVQRAQLVDLVSALPSGLDSLVGERGSRLSGGQRQRIGIGRALYTIPSVLVLDEATSALDSETEHRITETIESLKGRVTVVVIAHRLSTVRNCDKVAFLEEGSVTAVGSFREVMADSPAFARLVKLGSLDVQST